MNACYIGGVLKRVFLILSTVLAALLLTLAPVGLPTPLSSEGRQVVRVAAAQIGPFARPLDGRILFAKEGNLWQWERDAVRQLTEGDTWRQPQWSPNGQKIAYVYQAPYFSDVYLMSSSGGDFVRLTRSQSSVLEENDWNFHPRWSPDGKQLAYTSDSSSNYPSLMLMSADGGNKRMIFTPYGTMPAGVDTFSWSPDGKRIAVAAFGDRFSQIYNVELASGARKALTQAAEGALDPAWSPDGRWIAYSVRDGRRTVLHLMAADGSGSRPIADQSPARGPTWSPDGQHLAFLTAQGGTFEIWVMDVATEGDGLRVSTARQLTHKLGIDALSGLSWK